MTTACITRYISRSQNALQLTYVHVQFDPQHWLGGVDVTPPPKAKSWPQA